jgi:hypothetical protein
MENGYKKEYFCHYIFVGEEDYEFLQHNVTLWELEEHVDMYIGGRNRELIPYNP